MEMLARIHLSHHSAEQLTTFAADVSNQKAICRRSGKAAQDGTQPKTGQLRILLRVALLTYFFYDVDVISF